MDPYQDNCMHQCVLDPAFSFAAAGLGLAIIATIWLVVRVSRRLADNLSSRPSAPVAYVEDLSEEEEEEQEEEEEEEEETPEVTPAPIDS
jgi:hypothetical protein